MLADKNSLEKDLHIQISKDLDNRIREATHKAKTVYDKDLTRKYLVTKALETLLNGIEADNEAFKILIGVGNGNSSGDLGELTLTRSGS